MEKGYKKYLAHGREEIVGRTWPDRTITEHPVWCSVDLRDGNQALQEPMGIREKLELFRKLTDIGFKEIEISFPASSATEFDFTRKLIEGGYIPDDVTIQVLTQAREAQILRTFEALRGAKRAIFHFYNSTSEVQRRTVFRCGVEGVKKIAVDAARLIAEKGEELRKAGTELIYEYSPESFSGTETEYAADICSAVMEELGASADNKVILNLASTVECCTPNIFADKVERFSRLIKNREAATISVHTHNDRGTGAAAAELALMAGAERVEGTLFGNGERTGNCDLLILALNMYTQGVDPGLDVSDINAVRTVCERITKLRVPERYPYAGEYAFTAFSGSHQDAINKGLHYLEETGAKYWQVPYLPMDPADIGRRYEPIIRINSQSGSGGAAYIMETNFGYRLPKAMHHEFGELVKRETELVGAEITPERVFELFSEEYIGVNEPYSMLRHNFGESSDGSGHVRVHFEGLLKHKETEFAVSGDGNGPIDAFFNAIHGQKMDRFTFVDYSEHSISDGSDSRAVAYIHLRTRNGRDVFGVGTHVNINLAPLQGIICAINRALKDGKKDPV